jgi:DNA repair protein RadC
LDSPDKVLPLLSDIRDKKQEYFVLLTLDGANRLIHKHVVTIGTLTASLVHPREVFAPAIADRAASIIVAHNHPSGNLDPSQADCEITERLKQAGELLGVNLIDHIIVTNSDFSSIR